VEVNAMNAAGPSRQPDAPPPLVRILGYWKVKPAGYWTIQALWSSPSGRVLIGTIPDGRIGVINGNEFTPLNVPPVPDVVRDLALGAGAGAW
jgi:hypothetical protein